MTREEWKELLYDAWDRWDIDTYNRTCVVADKMLDEHEAQLKAKDEEIAKLKAQLIAQTTPENIIAMIRNSFSHATVVYTRGSCGRLYKILKEIFPNAIAYENGDHVISKIGDKFWDIKGEVKRTQNFKPCAPNNKMLSNYFGDDLQYIQCPQCDEVFYCGDEDEKDNACKN